MKNAKTRNDPKTISYRWQVLAWIVGHNGRYLTDSEDVAGVTPRIGAKDPGDAVELRELAAFLRDGFNMAAAVMIASSLEGDSTVVTLPASKPLSHAQAENAMKRMGVPASSTADIDALWHAPNRWESYARDPELLAAAVGDLSAAAAEGTSKGFPARKVLSVLAAHAATGPAVAVAERADTRTRELAAGPEPWHVTADDLRLRPEAEIVATLQRSDEASVLKWAAARVEQQWVGASSAAACLGTGVGYDTPEIVYETLLGGGPARKHTNAMVAGTARQEEVIAAAIATLGDEGWDVTRLLPPYGEATIADAANSWDVATLDCALELVHTDTGETRRAVLEVKVPDSITFSEKWQTSVTGADGKAVKHHICPPPVGMQIQDQMRLCGYEHGIATALKPSWEEARPDGLPSVAVVWVEADKRLQEHLAQAKKQMRRCVTTKTPPSQDTRYYSNANRQNVGQPSWVKKLETPKNVVTVDDTEAEPFRNLLGIQEREKQLKADKDSVRAEIDQIIGGANTVQLNGQEIATFKGRQAIDAAAFLADKRTRKYFEPGGDGDDSKIDWPRTLSNNPDVVADTIGSAETRAALRLSKAFRQDT